MRKLLTSILIITENIRINEIIMRTYIHFNPFIRVLWKSLEICANDKTDLKYFQPLNVTENYQYFTCYSIFIKFILFFFLLLSKKEQSLFFRGLNEKKIVFMSGRSINVKRKFHISYDYDSFVGCDANEMWSKYRHKADSNFTLYKQT